MFDYADYVCAKCFRSADDCKCEDSPYYLVNIDRSIQEHIRTLNDKGYSTRYCCESHKPTDSIYIMFSMDYRFDTLPDGFTYKKSGNSIHHRYPSGIDYDKFIEDKEKHLNKLLDWCDSLRSIR